jgi:hypothetical protein
VANRTDERRIGAIASLRRLRLTGAQIADVEARTKIRAKYLRALEHEEFGVLPGPTTVRSFLRTYAELVGLDPHALVEQYRAEHEEPEELDLQPIAAPSRGEARRERRERRPPPAGGPGPSPLALVGGALLAVVALLLVIGLVGGEDEDRGRQAKGRSDGTQAGERKGSGRRTRRRPRPAGASVRVAPIEPVYTCVDTGPGTPVVFEGVMDSPRTFRGRRVRINLGKTSLRLTLNGRRVPLEPSPTPVGYDVTARGARELPAGQRPCS